MEIIFEPNPRAGKKALSFSSSLSSSSQIPMPSFKLVSFNAQKKENENVTNITIDFDSVSKLPRWTYPPVLVLVPLHITLYKLMTIFPHKIYSLSFKCYEMYLILLYIPISPPPYLLPFPPPPGPTCPLKGHHPDLPQHEGFREGPDEVRIIFQLRDKTKN